MPVYWNGNEITGPRGPAGPDGNPIGSVISYLGTSAPNDYLICDGREYNLSTYPDLAEFFRTQFGAANHFGGEGETTFAVPDLRNLFLRGYHGEAGETLSGEVGQRQEATYIPYAKYGYNDIAAPSIGGEWNLPANADTEIGMLNYDVHSRTRFVGEWQMPYGYTPRPVNAAVLYCIKAVESIPVEEVYSTEETRVGMWANGKPLYRRVLKDLTLPVAAGDAAYPEYGLDTLNIDTLTRIDAVASKSNGERIPIPSFPNLLPSNPGGSAYIYYTFAKDKLLLRIRTNASTTWFEALVTITIEYTKTEGQEG